MVLGCGLHPDGASHTFLPAPTAGKQLDFPAFPIFGTPLPTSGRTVPFPRAPILIYQPPSPDLLSWQRMLHVNGAMCEQSWELAFRGGKKWQPEKSELVKCAQGRLCKPN